MIAFVNGILDDIYEDRAVIEVSGMGINVNISTFTASMLPPIGNQVKLYTYTAVREDAFLLYGFLSKDELDLFKKLITVNGVGPKGGLSILSVATASDIKYAILSGDVKLISSASGIGKKTAERIVLDLKDKFKYTENMIDKEIRINNSNFGVNTVLSSDKNEAVMGLMALGYSSTEAQHAVNQVENTEDMDVEAILKESLKFLL